MPFVFSNSIVRWFKANKVSIDDVRNSIDSAIAESVKGCDTERTETVKVSGAKTVTATVTLKDVTKASKVEASKPLRFAYFSQTLSGLEKVGCGPAMIEPAAELAEWARKFPAKEAKPEPADANANA